jgi:DNA-binding transcriptional MocR family regulator
LPEGGFAIWVEPAGDGDVPEHDLLAAAFDEGVLFDPGSQFRGDAAPTPLAMRLCYSAVRPQAIEEGVTRLARAWRRVGAEGSPRAARRW